MGLLAEESHTSSTATPRRTTAARDTRSTLPFTPKGIDDAEPRAAVTLEATKPRIGSIPNICGLMANAPGLLDTMSRVPRAVTDAVRSRTTIEDARFRALHDFTAAMVHTRARPDCAVLDRFFAAGYSPRNVLDIVLAIGVKTFTNYANHFFETPLEPAFAGRVWQQSDSERRHRAAAHRAGAGGRVH